MDSNNQKKLIVSLVVYNGRAYLPFCLKALSEQTFTDFEILAIDNDSTDGSLEYIQEFFPKVKIIKSAKNLGFARAHNQIISWTKSDYVLLLNQDVVLAKDFLQNSIECLNNNPQTGSLTGKILRWEFENNSYTNIIDSLGLEIFKNHAIADRGANQEDQAENSGEIQEVFGVSGAAPIYRRTALENVKEPTFRGLKNFEYLDEDFFSYKEDVDLAYRLRLAGWSSIYLPTAIAYHQRTVKSSGKNSVAELKKKRAERMSAVNAYSYANHLAVIIKNEFLRNILKDFFRIFFYELKKFFYCLLFERKTLQGLSVISKNFGQYSAKRKYIKNNLRKINSVVLRSWYK